MGTVHRCHINRSLDILDSWMVEQRKRVERNLQLVLWKVQAARNDGMSHAQMRTETSITRRV